MATTTGSVVARQMVAFLSDPDTGLRPAIAQLAEESGVPLVEIPPASIFSQNVSVDLAEKSLAVKYPVVYVYVDRVRNLRTEKFRNFSGKVRTVSEVRVSQDRIAGVEEQLRLYADAVTQVLDASRGRWAEGAFYAGGYEVTFDPVKHGGRNFLQVAKVTFEVDMSR